MNKKLAVLSLSTVLCSLAHPAFADDGDGRYGVVNGGNVGDFLGSGADVDRDSMDRAAEMEFRKVYLDQDPKQRAQISPPIGSDQLGTQAQLQAQAPQVQIHTQVQGRVKGQAPAAAEQEVCAATAAGCAQAQTSTRTPKYPPTIVWAGDKLANTNKQYQGPQLKHFFQSVGDILNPNWMIDYGLGPDDDTDSGPDNDNRNY